MLGYISVKNSIKRLKKAYVGIKSNKIIEKEGYVKVTGNNITDYFETSKSGYSYTFKDSNNDGIFVAENIGIHSSNAFIKLTAKRDIKTLSFNYYSRSEASNYDYLEIIHKGTRVVYQTGSSYTESIYTATDVKQGEVFTFRYRKDGSVHADPEYAQFSNFQVWDKVKSADGELGDYAKRIYKIYVGSKENKAKLMYEEGKIWHKTLTSLDAPRANIGATRLKSYALFAGGSNGTSYYSLIDVYSKSLVRHEPLTMDSPRSHTGATTANNIAFFGFGATSSTTNSNTVLTVDEEWSINKLTMNINRTAEAATSDNRYAVFAGGNSENNASLTNVAAIDSTDSTIITPPSLKTPLSDMKGTEFVKKAVFCGGYRRYSTSTLTDPTSYIHIYDEDLAMSTYSMSTSRFAHTSNSLGKFLVIAGGRSNWNLSNLKTLDIFNEEFAKVSGPTLTYARGSHASVVINDLLIISGGLVMSNQSVLNSVEVIDQDLTKVEHDLTLNNAKYNHAGVSLDYIGIFAGGYDVVGSYKGDVECFIV